MSPLTNVHGGSPIQYPPSSSPQVKVDIHSAGLTSTPPAKKSLITVFKEKIAEFRANQERLPHSQVHNTDVLRGATRQGDFGISLVLLAVIMLLLGLTAAVMGSRG